MVHCWLQMMAAKRSGGSVTLNDNLNEMIHQFRNKTVILFLLIILFMISCKFYFKTTKDQLTVNQQEASLENGRNLAFNICGGCHYDPGEKKFIGKHLNDLPK